MTVPIAIRIGLMLPAALLCACTSLSKQVYVASDTSLGVNGAMNTAQTAGKLVIGYDRKFVAFVPKITYEGDSDVMSVYNCTHLEITGLRISKFREKLATGKAVPKRSADKPTSCNPEMVTAQAPQAPRKGDSDGQ